MVEWKKRKKDWLIDKAVAILLDDTHFLEYRQNLIESDVLKWKTSDLRKFLKMKKVI
jgi:hypothetical protein